MACTVRQSPCAWRSTCRRCPTSGLGRCGVAGPMWAAALGGCEWLESWKLGRTLDDAVLDLVRKLADAPLPDPPPVLRALLGHTLDEVLLRGLTALYSLLGCEEQQRQPDGDSDGAAVSATWLDSQYRELAEDEKRLGPDHPSVRERQATLDQLSRLLSQKKSLKDKDPATSTGGSSSWGPSRVSSVADTSDLAAVTDAGATDAGASETASSAASTVQEASPRSASTAQERKLTERSPHNASLMPEWMLPGVDESEEDVRSGSLVGSEEEGEGKTTKKVRFSPDDEAATRKQSAAPPCECCMSRASPATPREPCVCPCGKATRICVIKHPECVCDEPSSDYFTDRGTSAMPSRSDAASPEAKRKASEAAEIPDETAGTGDPAASKVADKKASSARSSALSGHGGKAGEGAAPETDYHTAESSPQLKASGKKQPGSGPLWPRCTPCPCCPPRRRRPRGPATCPEQILWAITKICIFPDASRTYEVLTPSFEKPPRATGRTHVVFAMRPPEKPSEKPSTP